MSGDVHVRFCEHLRGQLPRVTRRNVYVRSMQAGQRVLRALRKAYARLRLKVNEAKTAVAPVWGRKFLGYSMWQGKGGQVQLAVSEQAMHKVRERLRAITSRTRGHSIDSIVRELQGYVPGWKAYFQLTQRPWALRRLDQWLRRRLRAVQLKQWRTGRTTYAALTRLGAPSALAASVACHVRRWWHCSLRVQSILNVAYFDRLGVPKFC